MKYTVCLDSVSNEISIGIHGMPIDTLACLSVRDLEKLRTDLQSAVAKVLEPVRSAVLVKSEEPQFTDIAAWVKWYTKIHLVTPIEAQWEWQRRDAGSKSLS